MVTKLQNNANGGSLNVTAIVQFFGGRPALIRDLKNYEIIELSIGAIDKWRVRGIPSARLADLQMLAKLTGKRFNVSHFRQRSKTKKAA